MEKILKICKPKTKIERKIHHVFVWNEKWSNLHMSVAYCEEVRFWETWHGRYTENRCICVYTKNERTCLIWFHSSPNIATSVLPTPLSAICLGTHVQTHIVIIVFVIFDCFLHLTGHVRKSRTNSSYWTVFTGSGHLVTNILGCPLCPGTSRESTHCLFNHKVKVHPLTSQAPNSYETE